MIKVAYLGAFCHDWNTESYISRAFERAGCEVLRIEETGSTVNSITVAVRDFQPDVFLFAKGRVGAEWDPSCKALSDVIDAVRKETPAHIACWVFDLLCKEFASDRYQWALNVENICDTFFMTDGYTATGIKNSVILQQGVPDDVDRECPWDVELQGDVLFIGSYYRDRSFMREALARKFGPRFQHVDNVRGKELTKLIRSYRICVGPQYPHFPGYHSNRLYVITGHGGLFACPTVAGMDYEGWRSGQNYLALPLEPERMAEKLEEYLTKCDPSQLATIRRNGYTLANYACIYDERVARLLAVVAAEAVDEPTELEREPDDEQATVELTRQADQEAADHADQQAAESESVPDLKAA